MSPVDRFRQYVEPALDGCWHWSGALFIESGYGAFRLDGRVVTAHRASFMLLLNVDPGEMLVCHRCDVRPCVRPEHLFLGTPRDNVVDMMVKGRGPTGAQRVEAVLSAENVALRKLTEADVKEILILAAAGTPRRDIADLYGVHKDTVAKILNGDTWSHLTGIPCRRHHWKEAS